MGWIDEVRATNQAFVAPDVAPGSGSIERVLITCMDPRIDLAAVGGGVAPSEPGPRTLVVRTAGARVEERSLLIGLFLTGVREVMVMTHTDCGCQHAGTRADDLRRAMEEALDPSDLAGFRDAIGSDDDDLGFWLRTFTDARDAAAEEVEFIRALAYVPDDVTVHGLVYDVATHRVDVVVDGGR